MAKANGTFEKCPKCKTRPASTGRNNWCNECNAEYQREYQAGREARAESRGFVRGVGEMRQAAAQHFEQFRFANFSGYEVARMIGTIPAPRLETQPEAQPASNGA